MKSHRALREFAVLEYEQRGNAHHAVIHREVAVFVHVDLDDFNRAVRFLFQLFELGRLRAARTAPRRPEVDEDGAVGFKNFLIEFLGIYVFHKIFSFAPRQNTRKRVDFSVKLVQLFDCLDVDVEQPVERGERDVLGGVVKVGHLVLLGGAVSHGVREFASVSAAARLNGARIFLARDGGVNAEKSAD